MDGLEGSLQSYNAQVPLNIGGRIPLGGNTYIFGQAGPYVSYAVVGGYEYGMKEIFNGGDGKNRTIVFGAAYMF